MRWIGPIVWDIVSTAIWSGLVALCGFGIAYRVIETPLAKANAIAWICFGIAVIVFTTLHLLTIAQSQWDADTYIKDTGKQWLFGVTVKEETDGN